MKTFLKKIILILSWILFPPYYLFLTYKNKTIRNNSKRWRYISTIISPFTICLIMVITFLTLSHLPRTFSVKKMQKTLNIEIEGEFIIEKNEINYSGQDYDAIITLKLSEESLKKISEKIEKSPFFNLKQDFYRNNENEWLKSDTVLYWKVRNYLKKEHLTGYWKKKDEFTYEFYSPNLSDIPNSALLFNEGFDIEANLSTKDKLLTYKYIKY